MTTQVNLEEIICTLIPRMQKIIADLQDQVQILRRENDKLLWQLSAAMTTLERVQKDGTTIDIIIFKALQLITGSVPATADLTGRAGTGTSPPVAAMMPSPTQGARTSTGTEGATGGDINEEQVS